MNKKYLRKFIGFKLIFVIFINYILNFKTQKNNLKLYYTMKVFFTIIIIAGMSITSIYANNELKKDDTEKNKPSFYQVRAKGYQQNHWFASIGVGPSLYFGDHDKQIGVGKRISYVINASGGKWIDDVFAVRVNARFGQMKGLTQYGGTNGLSTGVLYRAHDDLWYQKFNYFTAHADFMFDFTNDAYGYDPDRAYHLIPYAGLGFISATNKQGGTSFSPNLGVLQTYKLNDGFAISLDITGSFFRDKVDGEVGGRNFDGLLNATVGVVYNIYTGRR